MEGFFRRAGREPLASKLATEPVLSALNSSALLHANELHDTLSPWVGRASAELIPAQLALNQVLFDELGPALAAQQDVRRARQHAHSWSAGRSPARCDRRRPPRAPRDRSRDRCR